MADESRYKGKVIPLQACTGHRPYCVTYWL